MTPPSAPWSDLYRRRKAMQKRFGRIHDVPLVRRVHERVTPFLTDGMAVLDVGSGLGGLGATFARAGAAIEHVTLDPDPDAGATHRTWETVDQRFGVICCFEALEHMPLEVVRSTLTSIAAQLTDGGHAFLSTPNVFQPQEYLRDATHMTPLCYDQLGAMVEAAGLEVVAIHRGYHDSVLRRVLKRYVFGWLFRLLGIDYARQIVVTARRPGPSSAAS